MAAVRCSNSVSLFEPEESINTLLQDFFFLLGNLQARFGLQYLRHSESRLTLRAIDLSSAITFVALDMLTALRTCDFDLRHSVFGNSCNGYG